MLRQVLRWGKSVYMNCSGWHTDRHIVVIESDDWGSIRVPSRETFLRLQEMGDTPEKDGFLSNDSLESAKDMEALFAVLDSVHDEKGSPAVITANFVMRNPKFECIDIEHGKYVSECFTDTYERYFSDKGHTLQVLRDGISKGFFRPQLHCREHLNVARWMAALQEGKKDAITAFQNKMIGIHASFSPENIFGYMDELNMDKRTEIADMRCILREAMTQFEEVFGYRSKTFVAACFVWNRDIEKILFEEGVKGIQSGGLWQYAFNYTKGTTKLRKILRYCGQKNLNKQTYFIRNCDYEPAYDQNPQRWMERALRQVDNAFKNKKPAIINSHRFNYISAINPKNAEENLKGLQLLLSKIIKRYPDVEFLSSDRLLECIENEG